MENPINSQESFNAVIKLINEYDFLIDYLYNTLTKTIIEEDIVEIQAYIDRIKRLRLAWFKLSQIYTITNGSTENSNTETVYRCQRGDTLALISQAFYQNSEYGQYIYDYNELTTPLLEPNQPLKIPQINSSQPKVIGVNLINFIEQDRIDNGEY